jgi:arsenate reductase
MTDAITLNHNPRCSKSRATLELLRTQGYEPQIIEYLKEPPSETELAAILRLLGLKPRELMRKKEVEYQQEKLADPELKDKDLIRAMHEHPRLIERPIVLARGKAALGRPPEAVLKIL